MEQNAKVLLDKLLDARNAERGGEPLPDDEAFELFTLEEILKQRDLADEELLEGQIGGGDDGGVDGIFCFLDGHLVAEDSSVFDDDFDLKKIAKGAEIRLVVVQAKRTASFAEKAVQVIADTVTSILDLSKDEAELAAGPSSACGESADLSSSLGAPDSSGTPVSSSRSTMQLRATLGKINNKVKVHAERLCKEISDEAPRASAEVSFEGARELLDLAAEEKSYTLTLKFEEMAQAKDSHLLLVRLEDYADFIAEEDGALRNHIFDWNVRDFEGGVEVTWRLSFVATLSHRSSGG